MVRDLLRPSTLILFAANFVPVIGVVFWGWSILQLMMLYWMETIIILFWTVTWLATSPLLDDPKHRWNAGRGKGILDLVDALLNDPKYRSGVGPAGTAS